MALLTPKKRRFAGYFAVFMVAKSIGRIFRTSAPGDSKTVIVEEQKAVQVAEVGKSQQDALREYWTHLTTANQKVQEEYDKTVLALSSGALGISFVFVKDLVGTQAISRPTYLFAAWTTWAISVSFVLISYYASHLLLRRAVAQVNEAIRTSDATELRRGRPGGILNLVTRILNIFSGLLFFLGLVFMMLFAWNNFEKIGQKNNPSSSQKLTDVTTPTPTPSASDVDHNIQTGGSPNDGTR